MSDDESSWADGFLDDASQATPKAAPKKSSLFSKIKFDAKTETKPKPDDSAPAWVAADVAPSRVEMEDAPAWADNFFGDESKPKQTAAPKTTKKQSDDVAPSWADFVDDGAQDQATAAPKGKSSLFAASDEIDPDLILTGSGAVLEITPDLRKWMCYFNDGRLLVSKSHTFNPHVQAFKAKLMRMGRAVKLELVDLEAVTAAYAAALQAAPAASRAAERKTASEMHRAVKKIFEAAVQKKSSDIHFRISKKTGAKILFRVNNDLEFFGEESYEIGNQMCSTIYQSMADVSDATFEPMSRQDARIGDRSKLAAGLDGIRIATSPQVDGYIMVLRMLYQNTSDSSDLSALGYNATQSASIALMKRKPTGINIIAGPTGSGKSTTLQRVLFSLIKETKGRIHVITVEDPPEYPIPGAVQTPVTNAETDEERSRAFQAAIKAAMRLDPDVIMIGEIRDGASARLAVQGAMTGHQVWSTIHANGAFAIIDRLMDLGVAPELLCDPTILSGLSCQRLLKVLCPACKLPLHQNMARYEDADLNRICMVANEGAMYVNGPGCSQCRNTGTVGRTVCAENVITDEVMMAMLRKNERMKAVQYWNAAMGGITMLQHAIEKINAGVADPFFAEDVVGLLDAEMVSRAAIAMSTASDQAAPQQAPGH